MGTGIHSNTSWNATIASSSTVTTADDVFSLAMEFLDRNEDFCRKFVDTGGEIALTLKGDIDASLAADSPEHDRARCKVFDLSLSPDFLILLNRFALTFVIQMWA